MIINRFNKCSVNVKLVLFKSFCVSMNMYGLALWNHSVTVFSKLKSCYHKCIKKFFGFKRMDSMSGLLIDLSLPTLCPKKTCDYIFDNNFNNKCPITIIFGIVSSKPMRHRMMVSFPTSPI